MKNMRQVRNGRKSIKIVGENDEKLMRIFIRMIRVEWKSDRKDRKAIKLVKIWKI